MKIDKIQGYNNISQYSRRQEHSQVAAGKKENTKDKLHISPEAKELMSSLNVENRRQEKIQQLKRQVSEGTYFVEASKIAEKLLEFFRSPRK
jgi:negative regulator of flagellin synthesis FlgM